MPDRKSGKYNLPENVETVTVTVRFTEEELASIRSATKFDKLDSIENFIRAMTLSEVYFLEDERARYDGAKKNEEVLK